MILIGATAALCGTATHAAPPERQGFAIALRLPEWTTRHFDDPTKAQQHAESVKKLGAEVRLDQHADHSDVTYRCVGWKSLQVESDELAHQWQDWLKGSGFETLHGHDPDHEQHAHHEDHGHEHAEEHTDVILVRTADWVSRHLDSQQEAAELLILAKAFRCDVQQDSHGGHFDVRFRCPQWTAIDFPSHEAATAWTKWLQATGFEVRHEHSEVIQARFDREQLAH
ncbi:MAG: hypothetical protein CMJ58_26875 [Planctomycetaceae bacterium]|nr:hypothetical protein [Planctomycetaceae bacterium]